MNLKFKLSNLIKLVSRPLFLLTLLLLLFTVALNSRALTRHTSHSIKSRVQIFHLPPQLNATLLHHAAVEINEKQFKQEIHNLLHIDLSNFRKLLLHWFQNRRFQPSIMSELTHLIEFPVKPVTGKTKYSSCAVVGNSGVLLDKNYGGEIDSHEVVIRLNNARVGNFEAKVGKKTSISFMNSHTLHLCARNLGCFCHPYGDNVPIVTYIWFPVHFLDYVVCNGSHKAPLLITDPRFDVFCGRIVKYYSLKRFVEESGKSLEKWGEAHDGARFHYSSGMQAVMLALGICERVSIYGFGKSASAKHHYHTNQKNEFHLHDYEAEYEFYRDLVDGNKTIPFLEDKFKVPSVVLYH